MSTTPTRPADDQYLTGIEICDVLGISKDTLWMWAKAGKAPPRIKIGRTVRYPKAAFDQWIVDNAA